MPPSKAEMTVPMEALVWLLCHLLSVCAFSHTDKATLCCFYMGQILICILRRVGPGMGKWSVQCPPNKQ